MEMLTDIVSSTTILHGSKIMKRETLYKGMNGKCVERFYVSPSQSYIFKPLTNDEQAGKEWWVYEHILPSLPPIYPKIIAKSLSSDLDLNWIIFEDLGTLSHVYYNEEISLGVTKLMAKWHTLPTEKIANTPLRGPKPPIEEMASEIIAKQAEVMKTAQELKISEELLFYIYALLEKESFSTSRVLSYGELHPGNYAMAAGKIIVLDWEHAHLNTPFWDLYHLIDMPHPLFPRTVTSQTRDKLLKYYIKQRELSGIKINQQAFMREYYVFFAVFSIWMLLLIQKDLHRNDGKWPQDKLKAQLIQAAASLTQCTGQLDQMDR
jgi:thiamine kinase-like enzyme